MAASTRTCSPATSTSATPAPTTGTSTPATRSRSPATCAPRSRSPNLPEAFEDELATGRRPVSTRWSPTSAPSTCSSAAACHAVSPSLAATYEAGVPRARSATPSSRPATGGRRAGHRHAHLPVLRRPVRPLLRRRPHLRRRRLPASRSRARRRARVAALPAEFRDGIDAAFRAPDGTTYLFAGKQFLRSGTAPRGAGRRLWGKVRNEFAAGRRWTRRSSRRPASCTRSAAASTSGTPGDAASWSRTGYPRTIKDDWGDLPRDVRGGPSTARSSSRDATYLCNGERVRPLLRSGYDQVDRTFPQTFRHRWSRHRRLPARRRAHDRPVRRRWPAPGRRPRRLSCWPAAVRPVPATSADLFGWDVDELRWAPPQRRAPHRRPPRRTASSSSSCSGWSTCSPTARRLGAGPSRIRADVWSKLYGTRPDERGRGRRPRCTACSNAAPRRRSWPALAAQLHDELNVASGTRSSPRRAGPRRRLPRPVRPRYLIDVDMGAAAPRPGSARRSPRRSSTCTGTCSTSETVDLPADATRTTSGRGSRTWWAWMRNYRVWEANRKVFLYPENYLRPELRDDQDAGVRARWRTTCCRARSPPSPSQAAYKRYLDEYTEVSRLAIAGGYVYTEDGADDGTAPAGPVRPDQDRAAPVLLPRRRVPRRREALGDLGAVAEGRRADRRRAGATRCTRSAGCSCSGRSSRSSRRTTRRRRRSRPRQKDGGQTVSGAGAEDQVKIYYSFYNLNREWVPAQVLAVDEEQTGLIRTWRCTSRRRGGSPV